MPRVVTPRAGLTIKTALLLGFGLTLGLWIVTGYWLNQRFSDVESAAAAFNARYLRAQETLREVDNQVRLASVLLRDALLADEPGRTAVNRDALTATHKAAADALSQYAPVKDSAAERDGIARLRTELEAFRLATLAISPSRGPAPLSSSRLLRERVVPQRETVLRLSSRVQTTNREAFVAQTLATAQVYRQAQRQGWQQLGLALAANLAIGIWGVMYVGRLETRLRDQRTRDLQLTNDLHRLSARIVSAQEDERRMIARELHDEVGQTLAAIRVELAFALRPDVDAAAVAARLEDVRAITEGALHTIRDLSHLLHPAILDDLGLMAALESLVNSFSARHSVAVDLRAVDMATRLSAELETAIYRIVQEALSNVAKHAHARNCVVAVEQRAGVVQVIVDDDGSGFDDTRGPAPGLGLGLIGVRERAALLGGTLTVSSARRAGTRLQVELPLRKDGHEHSAPANLSW
jgi:signal transduction histidine kinase